MRTDKQMIRAAQRRLWAGFIIKATPVVAVMIYLGVMILRDL